MPLRILQYLLVIWRQLQCLLALQGKHQDDALMIGESQNRQDGCGVVWIFWCKRQAEALKIMNRYKYWLWCLVK